MPRRLAVRCAAEFGGAPEDHLVRVDGMAVVEWRCRARRRVNAGTAEHPEFVSWWEMYVELPLGRRPRRTVVEMPEDLAPPEHDRCDDSQVLAVLEQAARRRPEAREDALRASILELVALGLLPECRAGELLADHSWLAHTVQLLSALA